MHTKRGEIATILTVASLVVMAVGLFLGSTRKPDPTRSKAADEGCSYDATAVVVIGTKEGPLITEKENNNTQLMVRNNWGQEGFFVDTPRFGYYYNFNQDPFTFGPYKNPDTGYVDLVGLDDSATGWYIKRSFCESVNGGIGCATPEKPIITPPDKRISNFHITCGVHIKYGWVVERKSQTTPTPTTISSPTPSTKPTNTPTSTPTATTTPTPTATATPRLTPFIVPYKSPTPLASATPRATSTPTHTPTPSPTPIPTEQQAMCNTAATAGSYSEIADIKFWEMGNKAGTVYLSYQMYKEQDMLEISHDDVEKFSTGGFVDKLKSNIEINYVPKTNTKLKATLTSNRNSQNTLWWYTISCPRDPETSVGICLPDTTTKTISGTVKLDPVVAQLCKNNDCIASIQVKQDATAPLIKWAQGPDYTYHFPAVKALPNVIVEMNSFFIPNKPADFVHAVIPLNCFPPRYINEYGECVIDMTKEKDCRATDVDFAISSFNRTRPVVPNPLKATDVNRDGKINIVDFSLVLKALGSKTKGIPEDVNKDGRVNVLDLVKVSINASKTVGIE